MPQELIQYRDSPNEWQFSSSMLDLIVVRDGGHSYRPWLVLLNDRRTGHFFEYAVLDHSPTATEIEEMIKQTAMVHGSPTAIVCDRGDRSLIPRTIRTYSAMSPQIHGPIERWLGFFAKECSRLKNIPLSLEDVSRIVRIAVEVHNDQHLLRREAE